MFEVTRHGPSVPGPAAENRQRRAYALNLTMYTAKQKETLPSHGTPIINPREWREKEENFLQRSLQILFNLSVDNSVYVVCYADS